MNLYDRSEIEALLSRHGFRFSKSMGQNFLVQDWVTRELVAGAGVGPDCGVLEIGPGIGPLTRELAGAAAKVTAVELDRDLLPILQETLAGLDHVTVRSGDIMKLDLPRLVREEFSGLIPMVCANLPYNITTPVITTLLESRLFASVTVMIQKEAAQRICARPGSGNYGLLSVLCQYYANPTLLFDVPPSCFLPAPKVTSSVLHLACQPKPESVEDEAHFLRVVKGAFAMRRKTLSNSLLSCFTPGLTKQQLEQAILDSGMASSVRGEQLDLAGFIRLSQNIPNSSKK